MTVKEKIIKAVAELPADASIEDAMERLYLIGKIEKGLRQADEGKLVSHETVKRQMKRWLK